MLSDAQLRQYRERGYVSPLRAFPAEQARAFRIALEANERSHGGKLPEDHRRKTHLYLKWVDEIVHHPAILDAVERLIGPDILLYHLTYWIKEPRSDARISWHQDSTYFGLEPAEHVTAWVALADSNMESGCVQVVPGSHLGGQVPHAEGRLAGNMLRGQEIDVAGDAAIEHLVLRPGEFSLHHTHLFHNSMPNRSDDRRIGLGISYIPACCRCAARQRLSVTLVRGRDTHGHFDLDPRPSKDGDPEALSRHAEAVRRWHSARAELIPRAHGKAA